MVTGKVERDGTHRFSLSLSLSLLVEDLAIKKNKTKIFVIGNRKISQMVNGIWPY